MRRVVRRGQDLTARAERRGQVAVAVGLEHRALPGDVEEARAQLVVDDPPGLERDEDVAIVARRPGDALTGGVHVHTVEVYPVGQTDNPHGPRRAVAAVPGFPADHAPMVVPPRGAGCCRRVSSVRDA